MALDTYTNIDGSLGALKKIVLYFIEDVQNDDPANFVADNPQIIYYIEDTANLSERRKRDENGSYIDANIDFIVPEDRIELIEWINENKDRFFIAITEDTQGTDRIIGSITFPLEFIESYDSKKTVQERNDYRFQLSARYFVKGATDLNPIFALNFDGLNDYIQNGATPFVQWERTQDFTFYINLENVDSIAQQVIFDTRTVDNTSPGIIVQIIAGNIVFQLRSTSVNRYIAIAPIGIIKQNIQVTWNGSDLAFYGDGVVLTSTVVEDTLTTSIINADNSFVVGAKIATGTDFLYQGKINWLSFVNYAKNINEIITDYEIGSQSQGTGQLLLAIDLNRMSGISFQTVDPNAYTVNIFGQGAEGDWMCYENCI